MSYTGPVQTEFIVSQTKHGQGQDYDNGMSERLDDCNKTGESIEFAGKVVVALAMEQNIQRRTGKIVTTTDIAREYGIVDIDGKVPIDLRYQNSGCHL